MTDLLVRAVPDEVGRQLKVRAAAQHGSLQSEVSALLEESTRGQPFWAAAAEVRAAIASRTPGAWQHDSTLDIREDRDTDHGHGPLQHSLAEAMADAAEWRARLPAGLCRDAASLVREDRDADYGNP